MFFFSLFVNKINVHGKHRRIFDLDGQVGHLDLDATAGVGLLDNEIRHEFIILYQKYNKS